MTAADAERIAVAGMTDPDGPIVAQRLVGYPQLAIAVGRERGDDVLATRLVRQTVAHLGLLSAARDIAAFHLQPPSTGDARWDALIAGVAAHTWSTSGHLHTLPWTRITEPLPEQWEPGNMPARWRAWNLINTPPSLRERGVVFPADWLTAV